MLSNNNFSLKVPIYSLFEFYKIYKFIWHVNFIQKGHLQWGYPILFYRNRLKVLLIGVCDANGITLLQYMQCLLYIQNTFRAHNTWYPSGFGHVVVQLQLYILVTVQYTWTNPLWLHDFFQMVYIWPYRHCNIFAFNTPELTNKTFKIIKITMKSKLIIYFNSKVFWVYLHLKCKWVLHFVVSYIIYSSYIVYLYWQYYSAFIVCGFYVTSHS